MFRCVRKEELFVREMGARVCSAGGGCWQKAARKRAMPANVKALLLQLQKDIEGGCGLN